MTTLIDKALCGLDQLGLWLGLLGVRLILGWEYFEAGREKLHGANWFAEVSERFPFPFDRVPVDISWQLATGFELLGGIALVLGLGTRFFGVSLFVLTVVAIASVHWPAQWSTLGELLQGYALTDQGFGNYKLGAIYLAMLLPLILSGPGKLSLDALVRRALTRKP